MDEYGRSRTEITIETHSITTIKTRNGSRQLSHCETCLRGVTPLEIQHLVGIMGRDSNSVERLLSDGSIHKLSNSDICSNSLAIYIGRDINQIGNMTKQENRK